MADDVLCYYILSNTEGKPKFNKNYVMLNTDNAFVLQSDFSVKAKKIATDEGYLQKLDIYGELNELKKIEEVVFK